MRPVTESVLESAALSWFMALGYDLKSGPEISPGELLAEPGELRRGSSRGRFGDALRQLNPDVAAEGGGAGGGRPQGAQSQGAALITQNRNFHRMLVNGVEVEVPREGGGVRGDLVRLRRPGRSGQQRLAGRQPVHGGRGPARTAGRTWWSSSTACRWR